MPYFVRKVVNLLSLALVIVVTCSDVVASTEEVVVSVTVEDGEYRLHQGVVDNWAAKANFTDTTLVDGWSYLEVESNGDLPDLIQAYAAGYIEGASSKSVIYNSWRNTQEGYCESKGEKMCGDLRKFLQINMDWMRDMIRENRFTSPIWHHVELVLSQLYGLADGYNDSADVSISVEDILLMNLSGDLEDLEVALNSTLHKMTTEEWINSPYLFGDGHCSAIIKVLPGNSDLLVSHVTWSSFQSMLRTQKRYVLPFHFTANAPQPDGRPETGKIVPGHVATFSSYPTYLQSGDDYYVLSSGLLTMETTIGNSNPLLWSKVKPVGELQEWIRVLVANRLATTGKEWVDFFSQFNSGTYNNQWMVVDYKRFKPENPIKDDTLWVLEQIPGRVTSGDQSKVLRSQSYWPSYNSPFYPDIFNMSGGPLLVKKYGDWFSYDKTPRANIFRRDHQKVKDMDSLLRLMRYNDYKNDPLSACDCLPPYSAENAISARGDLNPKNGVYPFEALTHRNHAGTDVKMTNSRLFFKMKFQAVSGPTNDQQPTFVWSKSDYNNSTPHFGHPDAWNFGVVEHKWVW